MDCAPIRPRQMVLIVAIISMYIEERPFQATLDK